MLRLVGLGQPDGQDLRRGLLRHRRLGLLQHGVEWNEKNNGAGVRGAPAAGQVDDRARRAWTASAYNAVRLADLRRGRRHAVGPDPDPDRPADVPLDRAGLRRRPADGAGRLALRAVPHRAARHLPDVLRAGRVRRAGARPRRAAGAAGCGRSRTGSTRPARPRRPAAVRRAVVAAGRRRCCSGCACAVKWSALFFLPVVRCCWCSSWEVGARRSAGVRQPWRDALLDELGWLLLSFALIVVGVYLATWTGWFAHRQRLLPALAARPTASSEPPVIGALQNLLHYHQRGVQASTAAWTDRTRTSPGRGSGCCSAGRWRSTGPATAAAARRAAPPRSCCWARRCCGGRSSRRWPALAWFGIARRDWRAGAIGSCVVGRAAALVLLRARRPHDVLLLRAAGPAVPDPGGGLRARRDHDAGVGAGRRRSRRPRRDADRRLVGAVVAGAFVLLVALCFAYFYPIYVGQLIPYADWQRRMWLGSRWI